jgi:hypothetical protein
MQALNEKEKSKKLWEFLFILMGLAIIPCCALLYANYPQVASLDSSDYEKIKKYNNWENNVIAITKHISDIDSHLTSLDQRVKGTVTRAENLILSDIKSSTAKILKIEDNELTNALSTFIDHSTARIQANINTAQSIEEKKDEREIINN